MKNLWSKKWPRVLGVVLACGVLTLLLGAGGKLARPEREGAEEDKFIGFQLVFEAIMDRPLSDEERSYWVEYGEETLDTGSFGSFSIPRKILIGRYDEETGKYVFPGKEGVNCFLTTRIGENGEPVYTGYTDLADAQVKVGDQENSLSGTVYMGDMAPGHQSPEYGYSMTAYRVYQMKDGTVYLDGSGNGYAGEGDMTASTEESYTETVNGEERTTSLKVSFTVEWVERVNEVSVTWFDGEDRPLESRTLTLEEVGEGLTLERPQGAQWALVAETDENGAVRRTCHTLGEEGVSHRLVRLDERGMGTLTYLTLE